MWYLAILVAFAASTVNGQINCPPTLASNLIGSRTSTTFTLQNYCCIAQSTGILPTDNLVTLVGLSNVINNLDVTTINPRNPPLYSDFSNSGFFAAANGLVSDYCPTAGNLAAGIRIGNNASCLFNGNVFFCNGPLPSVGPYRVRVLVFRNGTLVGVTTPSEDITLRSPKDFNLIDTNINHHSAGMIAITTILPILFAILMAIFSTLLFMNCCCCRIFTPTKCQQE